jgi:hypothetical protein
MRDRQAYIKERLLFGPHTCRIGLCGQDGICAVELPATTTIGEKVWTTIYLCEKHAQVECERRSKKPRSKKAS